MNGKKPTREQRKLIIKCGLDPTEWLVVKNTIDELVLMSRTDKTMKTIQRG